MALVRLEIQPGIEKDRTSYSSKGRWVDAQWTRFDNGYPRKMGGWVPAVPDASVPLQDITGAKVWTDFESTSMAVMTTRHHLKVIDPIYTPSEYVDITPPYAATWLNLAVAAAPSFTANVGSNTFACHMAVDISAITPAISVGTVVQFAGTLGSVGGVALPQEVILTAVSGFDFDFELPTAASSTGTLNTSGVTATFTIVDVEYLSSATGIYGSGYYGVGPYGGVGSANIVSPYWSYDTFGQLFVATHDGCGPAVWCEPDGTPPAFSGGPPSTVTRATRIQNLTGVASPPLYADFILSSGESRHLIVGGTSDETTLAYDPLLVRWADQESLVVWNTATTNTAGSYRLSDGSGIVAAARLRREILIWTDTALYSMQYIGGQEVFGFHVIATNISIGAARTVVIHNDTAYWMGTNKFYQYNGQVTGLPATSSIENYVFSSISGFTEAHAGLNLKFEEVIWFYSGDHGDGAHTYYALYNFADHIWTVGRMDRTMWYDSAALSVPFAANGAVLLYHEYGNNGDDGSGEVAIEAYIESADLDINDGNTFAFVHRIIPDVDFSGSEADSYVTLQLIPRRAPGSAVGTNSRVAGNTTMSGVTITPYTERIGYRMRARQARLRVFSDTLDVAWMLGTQRIDVQEDGAK